MDELVGIRRRREGQAGNTELEEYLRSPHVEFDLGQAFSGRASLPTPKKEEPDQKNDRILFPSVAVLPVVVASTGCISVVPESVARLFAKTFPIEQFEPPVSLPVIHLEMLWLARDTDFQRHRWLRDTVCRVVAETDILAG